MEEQINKQQISGRKIPWYNNLQWYHTLIISIVLFVIYFSTQIALFDFAAVIGIGFTIWQIIKAIKNRKK